MELKFRKLRAEEIECRVATVKDGKGFSLLLYKDARCDMNILDETVGVLNWQRKHLRDNQNCIVSIYDEDKKMWIEKEDTGTESYTEKEKGLASDSFKRACFNFGIGRELYTAPFIWISESKDNTKYAKYDVMSIDYDERGNISKLAIANEKTKEVVYTFGLPKPKAKEQPSNIAKEVNREEKKKYPTCVNCNLPIVDMTLNGKKFDAQTIINKSNETYGRTLCLDCCAKAKKGEI